VCLQKIRQNRFMSKNPKQLSLLINGTLGGVSKTLNFTQVNNEKVTLSFRPANKADEDTLASYLPEGNITDMSQLPSSLPAYLIRVILEIKVNGEVVLSGSAMRLADELDVTMQAHIPGYGTLAHQTHRTVAGSYLSLNVISQSVSAQKLAQLQERLESTKALLESNSPNITREEVLGDMMYTGTLSYFAQLQAQSTIAGYSAKALTRMVAANGVFGYTPKVNYLFGMPRSITQGGIVLDIPMTSVAQSLDGNQTKTAQFLMQVGTTASALEHQVPEQMFSTDPANPVQAISAVKALQLASAEGQKIYQINQTNINTILPKLNLSSDIISKIRSEVAKGKEVTTHADNVSVPGWSGAGYIIIDPRTGEGAYMISGGSNGGGIPHWAANSLTAAVAVVGFLALSPYIALAFAIKFIMVAITLALILDTYADFLELMIKRDAVTGDCIGFAVAMTGIITVLSLADLFAPAILAGIIIFYPIIVAALGAFVISNICSLVFLSPKLYNKRYWYV